MSVFRELLDKFMSAIKRMTRQQRRHAERRARKEADRKFSAPSPWGRREVRRRAIKPAARGAKHTRTGPQRAPGSTPDRPEWAIWHTTQVPPWRKKAIARRRNRIAKASRRANRASR